MESRGKQYRAHPYDRNQSYRGSHPKELSSGKLVGATEEHALSPPLQKTSGDNTSKTNDPKLSLTPQSRPAKERLEFPNETSSERTLSTFRERRSALARISNPDLRDTLLRKSPHTSNIEWSEEATLLQNHDTPAGTSVRLSTHSTRVSTALRIQEPVEVGNINISIPKTLGKGDRKRRVAAPSGPIRRT